MNQSFAMAAFFSLLITAQAAPQASDEWTKKLLKEASQVDGVSLIDSGKPSKETPLMIIDGVKLLHESAHFNRVVIPGAALDVWLAMDVILKRSKMSGNQVTRTNASRLAGARAWNDQNQYVETSNLFKLSFDSLHTKEPLYVSGYGVETGSGTVWKHGEDWVKTLVFSLSQYGSVPMNEALLQKYAPLKSLSTCAVTNKKEIEKSIAELDQWIGKVRAKIHDQYPAVPHSEELATLPASLRQNLKYCEAAKKEPASKRVSLESLTPHHQKLVVWEQSPDLLKKPKAKWYEYTVKPEKNTAPEFQIPTP